MGTQESPPFHRRRLGRTLRELRDRARMSPSEVCRRLEFSPARLSRMENGLTAPDVLVVKGMLDEYGVPFNEWEPYLQLAREARRKGWWQLHGLPAMGYIALEAAADTVSEFALAYVPGLLQTEAYTRAVLSESLVRRTPQQFDSDVTVRMIRQKRLSAPNDPLKLAAVLDESVLAHLVGGSAVMHAQYEHLLRLAELPNLTLQVVPRSRGAHVGMSSAFTVLGFPEVDDPDIAYIAHVAGSVQVEKPDQVRTCRLTFDRLRSQALSPAASIELVERLVAGS